MNVSQKIKVLYEDKTYTFSVNNNRIKKETLKKCFPEGYSAPFTCIINGEKCFLAVDNDYYYLEKDIESYELGSISSGMK